MNNFNILIHQLKHHLNANNIISYKILEENIIVDYNKSPNVDMQSIIKIEDIKNNLNSLDILEMMHIINAGTVEIEENFNIQILSK